MHRNQLKDTGNMKLKKKKKSRRERDPDLKEIHEMPKE